MNENRCYNPKIMGKTAENKAPEVEITPTMIEAGVSVLESYDADDLAYSDHQSLVTQIFSAMLSQRREAPKKSGG